MENASAPIRFDLLLHSTFGDRELALNLYDRFLAWAPSRINEIRRLLLTENTRKALHALISLEEAARILRADRFARVLDVCRMNLRWKRKEMPSKITALLNSEIRRMRRYRGKAEHFS